VQGLVIPELRSDSGHLRRADEARRRLTLAAPAQLEIGPVLDGGAALAFASGGPAHVVLLRQRPRM